MSTTRQTAEAMIKAQEAYDQAKKALEQAKADVKEAFAMKGIKTEIVGDKKVTVIERPSPKFDAEKLASLVSSKIYKQVTKPAVDTKKFQSAVDLGLITPEVVASVDKSTVAVFPQVFDIKNADADEVQASVSRLA